MTRNMFFYTRKEAVQSVINDKPTFKSFKSSFNLEKVIRSEELENGNVLILLDDLHQRWQDAEVKNKAGKVTAIKKEVNTYQSELYLTEKQDIEDFYKLTNAAL